MNAAELPHRYYITYYYAHATGTVTGSLNMGREFPIRSIEDVHSVRAFITDHMLGGQPQPIGDVVVLGWQRYDEASA